MLCDPYGHSLVPVLRDSTGKTRDFAGCAEGRRTKPKHRSPLPLQGIFVVDFLRLKFKSRRGRQSLSSLKAAFLSCSSSRRQFSEGVLEFIVLQILMLRVNCERRTAASPHRRRCRGTLTAAPWVMAQCRRPRRLKF